MISRVDSMGGRNTARSLSSRVFKDKLFAKLNSKKRLPCLGLIASHRKSVHFRKASWNQPITDVLRRPSEPARQIRQCRGSQTEWHALLLQEENVVICTRCLRRDSHEN